MRVKPVLAVIASLLVLASLWYVQAPPRSASSYRDRAVETSETLRSQVQTTRIWLRALAEEETMRPAADVAIREAEEDASKAASTFEGYEPPAGTDALRRRLTSLGSDVTDALAEVRIGAQRGHWEQLPDRGPGLARLSKLLDNFKRETES